MLSLNQLLPDPTSLFQSAGSLTLAAAAGAGYGVVARFISPNAGIFPTHYALWFIVAYKIKEILNQSEEQAQFFVGNEPGKVIQLRNFLLKPVDQLLCSAFQLRPFEEVTRANVEEASFLEMCRFRIWNVFKNTIFDFVSIVTAHRLVHFARVSLPIRTSVPLFLLIRTIVQNVILAPVLYKYLNFCDHLAIELDLESARIAAGRARWIRDWLPSL